MRLIAVVALAAACGGSNPKAAPDFSDEEEVVMPGQTSGATARAAGPESAALDDGSYVVQLQRDGRRGQRWYTTVELDNERFERGTVGDSLDSGAIRERVVVRYAGTSEVVEAGRRLVVVVDRCDLRDGDERAAVRRGRKLEVWLVSANLSADPPLSDGERACLSYALFGSATPTPGEYDGPETWFPTAEPKRVGDSWQIDPEAFYDSFPNEIVTPTRVAGTAKLREVRPVDGVDTMIVELAVRSDRLDFKSASRDVRITSSELTSWTLLYLPVDLTAPVTRREDKYEFHVAGAAGGVEVELGGSLSAVLTRRRVE